MSEPALPRTRRAVVVATALPAAAPTAAPIAHARPAATSVRVDFHGDGSGDLAVAAPGENTNAGSVWVFKSTASGVTPTGSYTFGAGTLGTVAAGAGLGQGFAY